MKTLDKDKSVEYCKNADAFDAGVQATLSLLHDLAEEYNQIGDKAGYVELTAAHTILTQRIRKLRSISK